MNGRLAYVVGPSGAGKDSLIRYAQSALAGTRSIHFAQRAVCGRQADASESHLSLSVEEFDRALQTEAFCMHWTAHGLRYGMLRNAEMQLMLGRVVVVNGSRSYVPEALRLFPSMLLIVITARPELLMERLLLRGRETRRAIHARIQRVADWRPLMGIDQYVIDNSGAIEVAGDQLVNILRGELGARQKQAAALTPG